MTPESHELDPPKDSQLSQMDWKLVVLSSLFIILNILLYKELLTKRRNHALSNERCDWLSTEKNKK